MRWSLSLAVVLAACGNGAGDPDARRTADGPADAPPTDDAPPPDAPPPDASPPDGPLGLYPSICPGVPNNTEPDVFPATEVITNGSFAGTQDNGGHDDPDVVLTFELPDVDLIEAFVMGYDDLGDEAPMWISLSRCSGGIGCTHDTNSPSYAQAQRGRAGSYSVFVEGDDWFNVTTYAVYITGEITANARCDLPLAQNGALTCALGTTCDGTRCTAPGQCANGIDDDGDGLLGYPDDPGCAHLSDPSEADDCATTQLDCPQCATSADEDGDGDTGYPSDQGCTHIGDNTELHGCESDPDLCPMCSDGYDNDFDDHTDFPADCGCGWAAEDSEYPEHF